MEPTDLFRRLQAALGAAYALERELGGGGMSRVFVATESALGRKVVVKVLPPELSAGGVSVERFRREITLAAGLQHPHVVPLLAAGETADGLLYFTMPYVEGESLRARLARGGELPVPEVVRILRDVAGALAYAHGRGVVHRDIKPDNVLLSGGHAVVTDFGVARAISSAGGDSMPHGHAGALTSVGLVLGTPAYMAPEQAAGDAATDHRADLYALGVLGYELLAGEPPFAGRAPLQTLAAHAAEPVPPISGVRPAVPPALAALVMRLLEKRPADRPQSADEVRRELDAVATPSGLAAGTAATAPRTPAGAPRSPRRAVVGGVALLVAAAAAVTAFAMRGRLAGPPPADRARVVVAPFENATNSAEFAPVGRLAADWIARGLSQAGVGQVVDPDALGSAPNESAPDARAAPLQLARAAGAGTLVRGRYYRQRDSLYLQAEVWDATAGRVLRALDPVGGPAAEPLRIAEGVRQQMVSVLAALLDTRHGTVAAATVYAPRYEAYQAFVAGFEKMTEGNDEGAALVELERAAALDSNFTLPRVYALYAYFRQGQFARADSLMRRLDAARERLSPVERAMLDRMSATIRGDNVAAAAAARRAMEAAPGSVYHANVAALAARFANRPREALEYLDRAESGPGFNATSGRGNFSGRAATLHALGDHEAELRVTLQQRERFPSIMQALTDHGRALAALGRVAELQVLFDEAAALPPERGRTPGSVMLVAARELLRHGHPDEARAAAERAVRWHQGWTGPGESVPARQASLAAALYVAGRYDEARVVYERLLARDSTSVENRGILGAIAARTGRRDAAASTDAWLASLQAQPYLRGRDHLARARIAAALGQRERAVEELRLAFARGVAFTPDVHGDPDFVSLLGYPPYEELIRPKG